MLTVIRSIPIPRISISKIISYIEYLCTKTEGEVTISELREQKLDIGRGRGDITRFLQRLNIINVVNDRVMLTEQGQELCRYLNCRKVLVMKLHKIFKDNIPSYNITLSILREVGQITSDKLFDLVNSKISEQFPNAWINKVAFKTIIGFLEDVGVIRKRGNLIEYVSDIDVEQYVKCIEEKTVKLGQNYIISVDDLARCLEITNVDLLLDMLSRVQSCRVMRAPGKTMLVKIQDLDKFIREILTVNAGK